MICFPNATDSKLGSTDEVIADEVSNRRDSPMPRSFFWRPPRSILRVPNSDDASHLARAEAVVFETEDDFGIGLVNHRHFAAFGFDF